MLMKADVVPQDLSKDEEILTNCTARDDLEVQLLLGLIKKKKGEFKKKRLSSYLKLHRDREVEKAKLGKMIYKGFGCCANKIEAVKFLTLAKKNGIDKGDKFRAKYETSKLPKLERSSNT